MRNRTMGVLIAVLASGFVPGCWGRIAKEGLSVATGAKGLQAEIVPVSPGALTGGTSVRLGEIVDNSGGRTPAGFESMLRQEFAQKMQEAGIPTQGGGKAVTITGTILHYESAGLTGQVFGPFEEVFIRAALYDAAGRKVGSANCIGRSTTTKTQGVGHKADGAAKAIVAWIKKNYRK